MFTCRIRACLAGIACSTILAIGQPAQAQTSEAVAPPALQATPSPSPPQPSPGSSLEKQFLKNLLRDQKAIWTSPFHLEPQDARWLVPFGLGTAGLIATDRQTGDWIAGYPDLVDPSTAISYAGSGGTVAAATAALYVIGLATHNTRAREAGLLGAEALLNSSIVVTVLKNVTQRVRPDEGEDRSKFFVGGSSFPSGHSSGIWSFATVVAEEYHDRRAVQVVAYSIAGLVSVSRFTAQKHYLSDVLVGSAIGYGIGRYVYRAHHAGGPGSRSSTFPLIAPQYDRRARAYGIGLTWIY